MKYALEVIARERRFNGFLKLVSYRLRHSLFAGGWGPVIERDRIEMLNAVAAILYDPLSDRIVMVEQFRIGALEHGRGAWTLEPVGGVLNHGEGAELVVRREAMEESGLEIQELEYVCTYHVSPGTAADRVRLFCGRVHADEAFGVHGLMDEGEETRVKVIDADQAISGLSTGLVDTSSAIICIQWLALNRERLRTEWNR